LKTLICCSLTVHGGSQLAPFLGAAFFWGALVALGVEARTAVARALAAGTEAVPDSTGCTVMLTTGGAAMALGARLAGEAACTLSEEAVLADDALMSGGGDRSMSRSAAAAPSVASSAAATHFRFLLASAVPTVMANPGTTRAVL
jgi:hypothetical protein